MSSSFASTQTLVNSAQHSPAPYVMQDSAPLPAIAITTAALPGGEVLIDRVDEFIEVFCTLGHFTSNGTFRENGLNATQEQHECLASIIVHWLNDADTIVKAEDRGKRIAQRLLLGGLKKGIEIKELNTFIAMVCRAFKDLLDKLEAEEKSDNGTDSFTSLSERKEDMAAKKLDYHCNSLCFTLFMGVEDAIGKELEELALETALDSSVKMVVTTKNPNPLGETDNYCEKEQDAKGASTGHDGEGETYYLTFLDIPIIKQDDDIDISLASSGTITRT